MEVDENGVVLRILFNTTNAVVLEALRELTRARGPEWMMEFGRRLETMVKSGFTEGLSVDHEAALYDAQLAFVATLIREGLKDGDGNEIVRDGDG